MNLSTLKNFFSPKTLPALIGAVLVASLFVAVNAAQESHNKSSLASGSVSLWDNTAVPAIISNPNSDPVSLGVKFKTASYGKITGIKFYKGDQNIGTHSATLWTSTGQMLAHATFTNETASGWQQVSFDTPVAVTANTTYIASYFAPKGRFSYNLNYFKQALTNGPLTALADEENEGNSVYKYGPSNAFPTDTYYSANYWVDVIFEPLAADTPTPAPQPTCGTSLICQENQKPGNPESEWHISGSGDANIQGYADEMSVNKGETVQFKVKTDASDYRFDIYRLGYYGGNGARKIATVQPSATLPQTQPACINDETVGLVDCGNWAVSGSWAMPADTVSGLYIAKLVREDGTTGSSHVYFIVRDDEGHSDLLLQTSDATWHAYNEYGGSSLYRGTTAAPGGGRAYKVSYNRPITSRSDQFGPRVFLFNDEYPMIRWIEANGYNVSYISSLDVARSGQKLLGHKVFISSGHDEYWSKEMRTNVENARNNGVSLAWFSGNTMFWKTRWENSIDGANKAYKTLVTYKETHANAKIDPTSEWTGTWRDPRFSPASDGGKPENAVMGTIFTVNGIHEDAMTIPAEYGKMRLWRNTSVATLSAEQIATLPVGILGHEWEEDLDNGFRPEGLIHMSSTTVPISKKYIIDYGSNYGDGTATHNLTLYRHPSGSLVFGSGMIQWAWGLDSNHDRAGTPTDVRVQQATINLFADMGAQPSSLQPGLVLAAKSTDTTAPTVTITSPVNGTTITKSDDVIIQGTASDTGGGVVGGVEVSTDGGIKWHPAKGRENWQYAWAPTANGNIKIKVRATDDSGNIQANPQTITVAVAIICPCTIWSTNSTPATPSHTDTQSVELGVKFRTKKAGYITGIKFYKGSANTGTHIGNLWSNSGTRLAQAAFTNETASGWQQVNFTAPVPVTANTTYVASYFAPQGGYSVNFNYFTQPIERGSLTALANIEELNGAEKYSTASTFPTDTYKATNYWVDVVFDTESTASIWNEATTPSVKSNSGNAPVNLGIKFKPTTNGTITGIKFYKGPLNTGTHVGSVWSESGQLLAQATFSNETAEGWQKVNFDIPITVTANTTYIASYLAPNGGFAYNLYYLTQSILSGKLFVPANGGVYKYAASTQFPTQSFQSANYWVDVMFSATN